MPLSTSKLFVVVVVFKYISFLKKKKLFIFRNFALKNIIKQTLSHFSHLRFKYVDMKKKKLSSQLPCLFNLPLSYNNIYSFLLFVVYCTLAFSCHFLLKFFTEILREEVKYSPNAHHITIRRYMCIF